MSVSFSLTPIGVSDEPFLIELYASTRAREMAVVPWSDRQKRAFLQMQFEAQSAHYRDCYPNASFNIIKLNDEPIGRLYFADLADEIRIIDLSFLPQRFDRRIFAELIEKVLKISRESSKPVQIYLENFDPMTKTFSDLGFQKTLEHGIYFLWRREFADETPAASSEIGA